MLQKSNRSTMAVLLGTAMEWAEFSLYAYLTVVLSPLFFPPDLPDTLVTIQGFLIFAIGYGVRPVGALLFGYIADKYSRMKALSLSMMLMGIATTGMGLLPTYAQAGIWAPIGLLLCRLCQGLAISSEYQSAGIHMVEQSKPEDACYSGSLASMSAALGFVIGASLALLVTLFIDQFPNGWRVPFIMGGALAIIGFRLRQKMAAQAEGLVAARPQTVERAFSHTLSKQRLGLLATFTLGLMITLWLYWGNIFVVSYLVNYQGFTKHSAMAYSLVTELFVVLTLPLAGRLADKAPWLWLSRAPLLAVVGMGIMGAGLQQASSAALWASGICFVLVNVGISAPMFFLMAHAFPSQVRCTGAGLAWNIAGALCGGSSLLLAEWAVRHSHTDWLWLGFAGLCFLHTMTIEKLKAMVEQRQHPTQRLATIS